VSPEGPVPPTMPSPSTPWRDRPWLTQSLGRRLGCLLRFAIVLGLPIAGLTCLSHAMRLTVARDVPLNRCPIPGLPPSATHVSFAVAGAFGPVTIYEFDAPPMDVLAWTRGHGWTMRPIGDEPCRVHGIGHATCERTEPSKVVIDHGYVFEWFDPQAADHRTEVAYDAQHGRVYVEESYR
jgi:hypothetical protein